MDSPFPRPVDDEPDAWGGPDGRFSVTYETRAEILWDACIASGLVPRIDWAGTEDGEVMIAAHPTTGRTEWIISIEDPAEHAAIDERIRTGELAAWIQQLPEEWTRANSS